ncbi:hypothetical protein CYMTET_12014 [Cymbomonas tetramitiformis]|uniref:EGF-like domain-containing protein n=1 Tax=Cymbomonas tetramitiformis TaxID=36881 RepID=A0AAE0GL84_9CHLO|nr:hypothetical protein CYMTET_12014 [Cymbomonas tetramitiformis]
MASESSTLSKCAIQNTNADKNRDAAPVSLLDKLVRASNALQLAMILLVIVLWLSVFWMHRQPSDTVQGHVRHSADKEVRTSPNSSQPVDVGTVGTSESIVQVAPGFAPDSAGPRERSSARPALSSKPPQAPQRSQPQVRQVNEKSPLPQPGTAPLASEGRERSIAEFSGSAEQRGLFRSRTQQGSALDLRTFRNLLFDRKERSRNNIPKMKQVQQTRTSAAVKLSRQITPPKAHKLVQPTSSKTSTPISATVPKLAKQKSVPKMHRLVGSGRSETSTRTSANMASVRDSIVFHHKQLKPSEAKLVQSTSNTGGKQQAQPPTVSLGQAVDSVTNPSGNLLAAPRCGGRCKHGTCNEELSRCDCPVNRTGVDCSEPAMPECELIPGYEVACSAGVPLSCACFKVTSCRERCPPPHGGATLAKEQLHYSVSRLVRSRAETREIGEEKGTFGEGSLLPWRKAWCCAELARARRSKETQAAARDRPATEPGVVKAPYLVLNECATSTSRQHHQKVCGPWTPCMRLRRWQPSPCGLTWREGR